MTSVVGLGTPPSDAAASGTFHQTAERQRNRDRHVVAGLHDNARPVMTACRGVGSGDTPPLVRRPHVAVQDESLDADVIRRASSHKRVTLIIGWASKSSSIDDPTRAADAADPGSTCRST
jgi:hypothetical protein